MSQMRYGKSIGNIFDESLVGVALDESVCKIYIASC